MSTVNFSNFVAVKAIAHIVIQRVAREYLNRNENFWGDCIAPHLFSKFLSRREFALSVQARTKPLAAISPNYLLDAGVLCTQAEKIKDIFLHIANTVVFKCTFNYNKLYFDKNFAFALVFLKNTM